MQRLRLSLAIPLLFVLVLVQHGARLHELSHLTYSAAAPGLTALQAGHPVDGAVCPSCQAFAQVASAASNPPHSWAAPLTGPVFRSAPPSPLYSVGVPTPRSRGPPDA